MINWLGSRRPLEVILLMTAALLLGAGVIDLLVPDAAAVHAPS